ncbi:helix-turn-helix domain-containing protein [Paraflavitalea pollutisoli]|uniref:helix-turn-helix domain-containing protein n=1 Tax=Paraflavitalea pollutisoli TaxID=3034143 RepID=UPI0023EAE5B3|nr:helix-turn-helix domain-containing protein [Paraflavitalea sp. H1-2-19X]
MSLGHKVVSARKSKGLTQEQLAERATITVRTVQRIENDDSIPRDYTLKAIAAALNMPFEEFIPVRTCLKSCHEAMVVQEPESANRSETGHFLQLLNLSAFSYLVVPFVHFLIPIFLLRKKKQKDDTLQTTGQRIIRHQIYWTVSTHLLMLLTLIYNLVLVNWLGKSYLLNYLWIFAGMYILNAFIIGTTAFRLRNHHRASLIRG